MSRGHPSGIQLGAWFDEELEAWNAFELGVHIDRCRRCRRRVRDLERVHSALHGHPMPAPVPTTPTRSVGRLRLLVPAAVAIVFAVAVASATIGTTDNGQQTARRGGLPGGPSAPPADGPTIRPDAEVPPGGTAASPGGDTAGVPVAGRDDQPGVSPLRLGVLVATSGPLAEPSAEMVRAVRQVAEAANAGGGVSGRHVEVVAIDAADRATLRSLRSLVDVLVGGVNPVTTTVDVPWLLPADPNRAGPNVVAAEVAPLAAGSRLADELVARGLDGTVAVVVGEGPDAAFAEGIAQRLPVRTQQATSATTCDQELFELHRPGVVALAVAGPPELVERCADAAARRGWRPTGGLLVPPSAAYAGLALVPSAQLARTVLGLPWPTDNNPGAARFRSAVSDTGSYQALVAFAGAELAVDAARRYGTPTLEAIAAGTWATDLITFRGTANTSTTVVAARSGGWTRP